MTSSSSTDHPTFRVGRLGRPHGLDGFLGFYLDDADAALVAPGSTVTVGSLPMVVRELRRVERGYQIAFVDIHDRNGAEALRGIDVFAPTRRELGDDEFWPADLIGLAVVLETGETAGVVTDVITGGAQDRLVVSTRSGDREVPFVNDLVPTVDLTSGTITVSNLPGLLDW